MIPGIEPPASYRDGVPVPPDLARRLTKIAARLDADRVERDRLIVEAHGRGASLREIAKVAGITHVAVRKIIRAADGERKHK